MIRLQVLHGKKANKNRVGDKATGCEDAFGQVEAVYLYL